MSVTEIISIEPATGTEFWRGPVGDVDTEIAIARAAWGSWAATPVTVRAEALRRFANEVRKQTDALANCIARETGKPLWEAKNEIESLLGRVEASVGAYAKRTPKQVREGNLNTVHAVRHKPHGILGVLGPHSSPVDLPGAHIISALVAGNAVIFKPSEYASASGAMLIDCFVAAGIPAEVIRLLIGGPETGQALAAHSQIDGMLFTGSAHAGFALNRLYADKPGKVLALQMGGNNPIIAWDVKDIPAAAALIVQSAFSHAGQNCMAARRLIVQNGQHEALMEQVRKLARRAIVGDPCQSPAPFMGPVINNETADALQESFLTLLMKGGQPILQLERPSPELPFLTPGIIDMTAVNPSLDIELFGPILQLIRVPDFDAALQAANATRYGLCATLIGGTPELYNKFWANIRAGVINWNRPTTSVSATSPFGGNGLSGNHRPGGSYAADYCAYPVASSEDVQPRAMIGIGLHPIQQS